MNTKTGNAFVIISCICGPFLALSSGFAQGSLTPSGPPAPTMKSLDQIEPRTLISSLPYTITTAGSYYLTTNLTGMGGQNGITISSGNVTLNLNGFTVQGVAGSINGISISGSYANITVQNGIVSGWSDGVADTSGTYNLVLERLTVSDSYLGFTTTSPNAVVRDCSAFNNGDTGIDCENAGIISHCAACDNAITGIYCFGGVVSGCMASGNGELGIDVDNCAMSGCSVLNGEGDGIVMYFSMASGCSVQENVGTGIYVYGGTVSGCLVYYNSYSGIDCENTGCKIIGNTCIRNNIVNDTGSAGIFINGNNNRIEDNQVTTSGHAGIAILSSMNNNNNVIIKNSVSGNGANNYIAPPGNDLGPVGTASGSTSPWANISH